MVKVRLKTIGKPKAFDRISYALQKQWFLWQEEVFELGEKTVEVMKDRIEQTRKREKGKEGGLTSLIEMEVIDTTGKIHFGIGNIEKLKEQAPYYKFINDGGKIPGQKGNSPPKRVPYGIFSNYPKPSSEVPQTGRWIEKGKDEEGKSYTFTPKKPVEGKHFIEAGIFFFKRKLKEVLKKYVAMTRKETRKHG